MYLGYKIWDTRCEIKPAEAEDCTVCPEAGLWWRVGRWGKGRDGGGSAPHRPFSLFLSSCSLLTLFKSNTVDSLRTPFTSPVHVDSVDCCFLLHRLLPLLSLINWKAASHWLNQHCKSESGEAPGRSRCRMAVHAERGKADVMSSPDNKKADKMSWPDNTKADQTSRTHLTKIEVCKGPTRLSGSSKFRDRTPSPNVNQSSFPYFWLPKTIIELCASIPSR